MTDTVHAAPRPNALLTDPSLVRPDPYRAELRPTEALWLDRGECIDPEFTALAARILKEAPAHTIMAYPTPGPLYRKLAESLDVPENWLRLTPGTDGAIGLIFETYAEAGDLVLTTDPTYQMYDVYARMRGTPVHKVPYRLSNGRPALAGAEVVAAILDKRPRVVGIPFPDNPTGHAFEMDEMRAIVEAAAEVGALMLVDEAYNAFHPHTCLPWVKEFPNLVVTRSFSKAWGLAGIRLGYTVAQPAVTEILHKVRPMVESNGLSMFLAERMLDHQAERDASIARLLAGRKMLAEGLEEMGFFTIETPCNFVHVDFGTHREAAKAALKGVALYRVFPDSILKDFLRFTITTPELTERVLACLRPIAPGRAG